MSSFDDTASWPRGNGLANAEPRHLLPHADQVSRSQHSDPDPVGAHDGGGMVAIEPDVAAPRLAKGRLTVGHDSYYTSGTMHGVVFATGEPYAR